MAVIDQTLTGGEYRVARWPQPGTVRWLSPAPYLPIEFAPVVLRLTELLDLRPGWNTYDSSPIQAGAVATAVNVLARSGFVGLLPDVVPISRGGVQLQWGGDEEAVEIECHADGTISILVDYDGQMREWAADGADDPRLSEAFAWVDKIA